MYKFIQQELQFKRARGLSSYFRCATSLLLFGLVFLALSLQSCDGGGHNAGQSQNAFRHKSRKPMLVPSSSGNPYEVMVVVDDEEMWNGYVGEAIRQVLQRPIPMLPQEEASFHVSHITEPHYDRITKLFRNVVLIRVNEHFSEPRIKLERDVYSYPQLVMTIQGPSENEISTFITEQTKVILNALTAEEINRQAYQLVDRHNIKFDKKVYDMFGCHLFIPIDLKKMKVGKDFIWASDDGLSSIQNIVIYSYPYVSEKVFTRHAFIGLRNKFMTQIPGEHEGSVMSTNGDYVETSDIQINGHYVQEARGLWEMSKDAMGGPFISHSQVDTINNRVIVAEGFVYAPDKMKRTMLRRLQAALYTLQLPASEKTDITNEQN